MQASHLVPSVQVAHGKPTTVPLPEGEAASDPSLAPLQEPQSTATGATIPAGARAEVSNLH